MMGFDSRSVNASLVNLDGKAQVLIEQLGRLVPLLGCEIWVQLLKSD